MGIPAWVPVPGKYEYGILPKKNRQVPARRYLSTTGTYSLEALVYEFDLNGQLFVAKRFLNIGNSGPVNPDQNRDNLVGKAQRLKQGQWFLKEFYDRSETAGVMIELDLEFTDVFLMKEIISASALRLHTSIYS
ncbi:hypothetical protein SISSUDRAFT_1067690 [Sistotremastrum suecicum HHB10207 ss-3]|uniref:Uncharacterized protein n=1 Tax=Sistotremastrum suecicum HHB10207 ss-3 TaxID=1314776 RepID=A0A165WU42_9AGAM|nr:hypothetical protein SISSUDRAFT_1067690 [Sistotremastrum suecicum HHB10207 ss-3]